MKKVEELADAILPGYRPAAGCQSDSWSLRHLLLAGGKEKGSGVDFIGGTRLFEVCHARVSARSRLPEWR